MRGSIYYCVRVRKPWKEVPEYRKSPTHPLWGALRHSMTSNNQYRIKLSAAPKSFCLCRTRLGGKYIASPPPLLLFLSILHTGAHRPPWEKTFQRWFKKPPAQLLPSPVPSQLWFPESTSTRVAFWSVSSVNRGVSVFPSGHPHFSRTNRTLAEARSPEKVSGADTMHSRDTERDGGWRLAWDAGKLIWTHF